MDLDQTRQAAVDLGREGIGKFKTPCPSYEVARFFEATKRERQDGISETGLFMVMEGWGVNPPGNDGPVRQDCPSKILGNFIN